MCFVVCAQLVYELAKARAEQSEMAGKLAKVRHANVWSPKLKLKAKSKVRRNNAVCILQVGCRPKCGVFQSRVVRPVCVLGFGLCPSKNCESSLP